MAQLVERRVRNAKARGSNPLISTKTPLKRCFFVGIRCNFVAHGRAMPLAFGQAACDWLWQQSL